MLLISRAFQVRKVFLEEPGFLENQVQLVLRAHREFRAFLESA